MVQYYKDMWPSQYHKLAPLKEASISPKSKKILWNEVLEDSLKELKRTFSTESLLSYPGWRILFWVHTNSSDKQLVAVISQNNKPISFP